MKYTDILCDSSSLISLTGSCSSQLLYFFHKKYNIRFLIPPSVEYESVERPLNMKSRQYALSALRIKKAIQDGVVVVIDAKVDKRAQELEKIANNIFFVKGYPLKIVHTGEMEMIALSEHLGVKNILVDERTTRLISEAPFRYKEHLEKEFKVVVMLNKKNLLDIKKIVENMKIIRSSELLILAYEHGMFDNFNSMKKEFLEAGLYSLKYSGCSIQSFEIDKYLGSI